MVTRKECRRLREGFEVRGFKKGLWIISKKRTCWKTEERCPKKTETCSVNTKPCMKNTFSAVDKEEERERWNKDAKEEGDAVGKERWKGKAKGFR